MKQVELRQLTESLDAHAYIPGHSLAEMGTDGKDRQGRGVSPGWPSVSMRMFDPSDQQQPACYDVFS